MKPIPPVRFLVVMDKRGRLWTVQPSRFYEGLAWYMETERMDKYRWNFNGYEILGEL